MLQKLSQHISQHISECYDRAADCKRRAEQTTDSARKTELLDFERSWTRLAHSYEFGESLERFLLAAPATIQIENRTMTQLALARTERRGCPKCPDCGATMRLFGIEAHPTIDRCDLYTYVCSHCGGLQTEILPLRN